MAKLKRYDMCKLLADPKIRRYFATHGTQFVMAIEGVDLTLKECEDSYDRVIKEKNEKNCKSKRHPHRG